MVVLTNYYSRFLQKGEKFMDNKHLGKRILQQEEEKKKGLNPFVFYNKTEKGVKPFEELSESVNHEHRFAIMRTTENGKYVRSGQLWFSLNGVEIFTDLDNIIYVDTINNTFIVKNGNKIIEEISPEDPEQRQYVLLMKCVDDNEEEYFKWESMTGRTYCYNYIVNNIDLFSIYPDESFVLTERVSLKDAITISEFVRYLKNAELVEEDGFDIDEYIY